jgi:hypothetical protein
MKSVLSGNEQFSDRFAAKFAINSVYFRSLVRFSHVGRYMLFERIPDFICC